MIKWKKLGMIVVTAIAASVYCLLKPTIADENSWSSGGPYDASVWSIAIDPADNQHLYIGTLENFLFQTTNGGEEWLRIRERIATKTIRVVKIHPFGPDTMFIATTRGVYKSTDAGEIWTLLPVGIQHGEDWPLGEWDRLEISRTDPPVLFVGNGLPGASFRSTDGGETWLDIPMATAAVKADPVRPHVIYRSTNYNPAYSLIWKSTDSGVTWQNISDGIEFVVGCKDIEVDPVDPEIMYAAGESNPGDGGTLIKSTNGGEYWIDITPPGLTESFLRNVEVAPLDHNTIIVGSEGDRVLRSTDGGATWEAANQGIIGMNRRAQTLTSDHATGIIYLGFYAGGIYRSADDGASWEKISYNVTGAQVFDIAANFRDPDTLFIATRNGPYMSTDGAVSWQYIDLNFPHGYPGSDNVEVDPYDPSYVYVSYYGRNVPDPYEGAFYRSSDGGATWETFTQGLLPGRWYTEIKVADYGGGTRRLYMGSKYGLFRSDDLGESWSLCGGGLPPDIRCRSLDVSPVNPDLVLVGGGLSHELYKSADGGETWENLINLPGDYDERVDEIACDPVNPDVLYAIIGRHAYYLYKSTDCGQSWSDRIIRHDPSGISINPWNPTNLFVYSGFWGVFQSHDGGFTWEDYNLNMGQCNSSQGLTLIDPVDTNRVFAGMWGNSVWEITRVDTTTTIDDQENILPVAFSASSYPNPFNPSATIEYDLPEQAFVTMDIYDLIGRRVERLVGEDQLAGRYRVIWEAKERASGLYYYKINAGQYSKTGVMTLLK